MRLWNAMRSEDAKMLVHRLRPRLDEIRNELRRNGQHPVRIDVDAEDCAEYGLNVWFRTRSEASRAAQVLRRHLGSVPNVEVRRNVFITHITIASGGKGKVLKMLSDELGVEPNRVLAVGDSANDIDMLDGSCGFQSAAPADSELLVRRLVGRNGGILAQRHGSSGAAEILRRVLSARTEK